MRFFNHFFYLFDSEIMGHGRFTQIHTEWNRQLVESQPALRERKPEERLSDSISNHAVRGRERDLGSRVRCSCGGGEVEDDMSGSEVQRSPAKRRTRLRKNH